MGILKLISKPSFWLSIIIAVVCFVLIVIMNYLTRRIKRREAEKGKMAFNAGALTSLFRYIIAVFGVLTILQVNGVNVTSLITGIGVAGIVAGFAIQDILKDIVMGTNIIWNEFFRVGDVVTYNGKTGKVIGFNLRVTKIKLASEGSILVVSNRNISDIECSSGVVLIDVPAPYGVPAERMRQVCGRISEKIALFPEVSGAVFCGTQDFLESSVLYRVKVTCTPETALQTRRDCLGAVQDVFALENIEIPFNQLDVHIDRREET